MNERALRDVIAEVARRRSVVVIAHRLSTVAQAQQIVVLVDGVVQAIGTHDRLLDDSPTYRRFCAEQLITTHADADRVAAHGG